MFALIAKALGSATSSVFRPRSTLCFKNLLGTTTHADCNPPKLKTFEPAIQVIDMSRQTSFTLANGIYSFPGLVISQ